MVVMYRKKQFPSISTGRDLKGGALLVSTKGTSSLKRPSLFSASSKLPVYAYMHKQPKIPKKGKSKHQKQKQGKRRKVLLRTI